MCEECSKTIIVRRVPARQKLSGVWAVYAASNYSQPLAATLVQKLKYAGMRSLAEECARLIASHLSLVQFVPEKSALLIAVPLSSLRLKERGFNQSELIARHLARVYSLPFVPHTLLRARHTKPQTEVGDRKTRIENVKGAFACYNSEAIKGKQILLVDDVMTTGATLSECARALKSAGAKRVVALVVAS